MIPGRGLERTANTLTTLVSPTKRQDKTGYISWGVPIHNPLGPVINENAGKLNKYEELKKIGGDIGLEAFKPSEAQNLASSRFPLFGRKFKHTRGRDIKIALQPADVAGFFMGGHCDFFTSFSPSDAEYRVWIYRGRHLGTYEKHLVRPEQYKKPWRSYRNGFRFSLVAAENVPREAVDIATTAVRRLELDFGAVDIIRSAGSYKVLEVNTAPGVEGPERQVIRALARRISRWHDAGFPKRHSNDYSEREERRAA